MFPDLRHFVFGFCLLFADLFCGRGGTGAEGNDAPRPRVVCLQAGGHGGRGRRRSPAAGRMFAGGRARGPVETTLPGRGVYFLRTGGHGGRGRRRPPGRGPYRCGRADTGAGRNDIPRRRIVLLPAAAGRNFCGREDQKRRGRRRSPAAGRIVAGGRVQEAEERTLPACGSHISHQPSGLRSCFRSSSTKITSLPTLSSGL